MREDSGGFIYCIIVTESIISGEGIVNNDRNVGMLVWVLMYPTIEPPVAYDEVEGDCI